MKRCSQWCNLSMLRISYLRQQRSVMLVPSACCGPARSSVMVSAAVSQLGCTELFFVEPGVKANGAYYRDVLLMQKVLPVIRHMSGNFFVFQQDSAPAHRVRDTVALLRRETAELIGPELWPAKSPDLNPVDYNICGLIQERIYQTSIRNIDDLNQCLISVW